MPVADPGRKRAVPGTPRKVASCSRLTTASTTVAVLGARGKRSARRLGVALDQHLGSLAVLAVGAGDRHREHCPPPDESRGLVRSKTYCTGRVDAAATG